VKPSAPATPATITVPTGVLPVPIAAAPPMAMQPPARKARSLVSDFNASQVVGTGPTHGKRVTRLPPRSTSRN
jgi:hypothetical protein